MAKHWWLAGHANWLTKLMMIRAQTGSSADSDALLRHQRRHRNDPVSRHEPVHEQALDETTRLYVQSDVPSWTYPVPNIGYEEVAR